MSDSIPSELGDRLVEPSRIEPQTDRTQPDVGTKLFVMFFFLVVPPLGLVILATVCWKLYRGFMAT